METDLRASLVAAAAAALLSSLVGAIAGIGFGVIALRAILGGALFGGLVFAALALARRVLPGLGAGPALAGGPGLEGPGALTEGMGPLEEEEGRGRAVNIVLPGEGPSGEGLEEAAPLQELSPAPAEPPPGRKAPAAPPLAALEEVGPELSGAEELGSLIGPDEAEGGAAALPPASGRGSASFEDLDVLPDLEGFSDSFAPAEMHPAAEPAPSSRGGSSGGGGGGRSEPLDPAALAQAVRTILKRDQKG
ncbi:MAG TPA: hypothetical protein PLB91_05695 [Spirochaetales bacterium]|nr:hypothetical protein [Spirochaetales bacterium]HRY56362.1 hypothetical protein [Spirochaetia bacterium]HRZ66438.1 hypothetical protein [Spirochaetia bacterium]